MWPFKKREKARELTLKERIQFNSAHELERLEIPEGSFAITFTDMDMGSIMGGVPDREPELAASLEQALSIAATNGDEEEVGVFNSRRELVAWRYGKTEFHRSGTH